MKTASREEAKRAKDAKKGQAVLRAFALSRHAVLVAALLLSAPLMADPPAVGADAPNFKAHGTVINPPEFARELKDSKGDVILIYEWNARDGTRSGLGDIQTYHSKWNGKGLQVWTIHRLDFEKFPQIDVMARAEGWTFPICMGGFYDDKNDFFGYKEGKTFRACVVGVDGKVAWYGKGDGWKAPLDTELKKVLYPNLTKHAVHDTAHLAAKKLGEREFGKALLDCEKLLAGELAPEPKADLELVQKRANELATLRRERVKKAIEERRYDIAQQTLTLLDEEFRGHKISDEAKEELKALKKDKAIKKELDTFEKLDKVIAKDGKGDPQTFINALRAFAKGMPNTSAGTVAEKMADRLQADME
jgi:hypothetical protein